MKKSILLMSGLGIGAGVLYAIGTRGNTSLSKRSNGKELTGTDGNGKSDRAASKFSSKRELGSGDEEKKSSLGYIEDGSQDHEIDDQGTNQSEASQILRHIRDAAFDSSNENLALALGRPTEEIEAEISGARSIDGDELMKARKLAMVRGVDV